MQTVLYIGNFFFPMGNAAGRRVYANGKLLRALGYNVIYVGLDRGVAKDTDLSLTESSHDGFLCYSLPYPAKNLDWLNYRKTYRQIIGLLEKKGMTKDLKFVILYGSPSLSLFNSKMINFCRRNKIKVLADCVDWLTVKTESPLFDLIKWADTTYQKAYCNRQCDGLLVISKYLAQYYVKSGKKALVIPPLSPVEHTEYEYQLNLRKIVSYAGQPFRKGQRILDCSQLKDRIDKTILLLHSAKKSGCNFVFDVYGFTRDEYLYALPSQGKYVEELGESICFHGMLPNDEVVRSIRASDFTILIRDVNRSTAAGFPTKVSESITCGTPVITTRTSDLADYITEGIHGYFVDGDVEKAIFDVISILDLPPSHVATMKYECYSSKTFSYSKYVDACEQFLAEVVGSRP